MEYTIDELAQELGTSVYRVRAVISAGCPHRTTTLHTFVNGHTFAHFVRPRTPRIKLEENEAYCLKCRQAVPLVVECVIPTNGKSELAKGICPICGTAIHRARRRR